MRKNGDVASPGEGLLSRGMQKCDSCRSKIYEQKSLPCVLLTIAVLGFHQMIWKRRGENSASVADSDILLAHFLKFLAFKFISYLLTFTSSVALLFHHVVSGIMFSAHS